MKIVKILSFGIIFLSFMQITSMVFAISVPTNCKITSVLRIGSKGAEVQCLQEKLGISTDGNFGLLTKAAVVSFQSRNGLVSDGVIGPLSRLALDSVIVKSGIYPSGCTSIMGYSSTNGAKCDGSLTTKVSATKSDSLKLLTQTTNKTKKINSNLTNLDKFIATVVDVNKKKGSSETELKLIADSLKQAVLTSDIDYNKEFKNLLERESKLSAILNTRTSLTLFEKVKNKTLSFLGITPSVAQAEGAVPFGGALLFPFFCAVSGNWMIAVQPLPPTYVVLLSYFPGTQGFAGYNIPVTTYLLGTYVPAGVCSYGTVTITTEGTITPMVGSSAI